MVHRNIVEKKLILIVLLIIAIVFVSGCVEKECIIKENCPDKTCFTKDCTDYNCSYSPILSCCGNEICEIGETYEDCKDCSNCDDKDRCTEDSFDYKQHECVNKEIIPCCGNGKCDPGETYEECTDCIKAGQFEKPEVWGGTIHVIGDIEIKEEATLTILPGTTILVSANNDTNNLFGHWECDGIENFDMLTGISKKNHYICGIHTGEPYRDEGHHISIKIKGTLKAVGTEENRIVFKSDSSNPTIYDWNHLEVYQGILSYAKVENCRVLAAKGKDTEISYNILSPAGETGIWIEGEPKILFNNISHAGHELIGMYNSSPYIYHNYLGPNPRQPCIVVDAGGSPQIIANEIRGCSHGIAFISPPGDPTIENNIFSDNWENIAYTY